MMMNSERKPWPYLIRGVLPAAPELFSWVIPRTEVWLWPSSYKALLICVWILEILVTWIQVFTTIQKTYSHTYSALFTHLQAQIFHRVHSRASHNSHISLNWKRGESSQGITTLRFIANQTVSASNAILWVTFLLSSSKSDRGDNDQSSDYNQCQEIYSSSLSFQVHCKSVVHVESDKDILLERL